MPDNGLKTHIVYRPSYIVVTGNLSAGFSFYGPFDGILKAEKWVEENLKAGEWWQVHIMSNVRFGAG